MSTSAFSIRAHDAYLWFTHYTFRTANDVSFSWRIHRVRYATHIPHRCPEIYLKMSAAAPRRLRSLSSFQIYRY